MLAFPLPFHTLTFHIKEFSGSWAVCALPEPELSDSPLPLVITTLGVSTQLQLWACLHSSLIQFQNSHFINKMILLQALEMPVMRLSLRN